MGFSGRDPDLAGVGAGFAAAGSLRDLHALHRCLPYAGHCAGRYRIDARRCISYLTIELRGSMPEEMRAGIGHHVFGCDICQDVCPWNRRAPVAEEPAFEPQHFAPALDDLALLSESEFREMFRASPIQRAKYAGFLRNVAIAMGNSRQEKFREPLERLADFPDEMVAEHARWALEQIAPG